MIFLFTMSYITLPSVKLSDFLLDKALMKRRSVRKFKEQDITLYELSKLLWAGDGITDTVNGFRTAPSAGALYPLDLYILMKDGIYRYLPEKHAIVMVEEGDKRKKLKRACLNQEWVFAPLVIVLIGFPDRIVPKYGERGIRYIYLESGHIAQNIHLEAVSLGMGSVPVGAFYDEEIKKIIGVRNCIVTYVIPVGRK